MNNRSKRDTSFSSKNGCCYHATDACLHNANISKVDEEQTALKSAVREAKTLVGISVQQEVLWRAHGEYLSALSVSKVNVFEYLTIGQKKGDEPVNLPFGFGLSLEKPGKAFLTRTQRR
jgi:hypothetical protein